MRLVKIATAGSVDDGKSTLIGRILYDTKSVSLDQIEHVKKISTQKGKKNLDYSFFTDGLIAEREQGITIDVAHIFFSTPKAKFIIADSPGHDQYTRNMITGASDAHIAIILLDARNGIVQQTLRHLYITMMVGIRHIIFCINKMDLVGYSKEIYDNIIKDFENTFHRETSQLNIHFVPIAALTGENVLQEEKKNMPWYNGKALLEILHSIKIYPDKELPFRMYVQYAIRPQQKEYLDFRGYSGLIASGSISQKDTLTVLPSKKESKVKNIFHGVTEKKNAKAQESILLVPHDDIDISRGSLLIKKGEKKPVETKNMIAELCWMDNNTSLNLLTKYTIQIYSKRAFIKFKNIQGTLDLEKQNFIPTNTPISLNTIFKAEITMAENMYIEPKEENIYNSRFILINEQTHSTVAVGICLKIL